MNRKKEIKLDILNTKKLVLTSILFLIDSAKNHYYHTEDSTSRLYIAQQIEKFAKAYETVANAKD